MAITSSGSFVTANDKTAGTLFSFPTTTNVPANSLAVLFIGTDNLTTTLASNDIQSVTDNSVLATSFNFLAGTGFNGAVHTIVTQSDGKIIAGGEFTSYSGSSVNRIARLNTNGTLDTTFVQGTGFNDTVYKLLIQNVSGSDGVTNNKIVAVGAFTQYSGSTYSGSVRITQSGSVDRSFSVGTGSFNGTVYTVALETTSSYTQVTGGAPYTSKLIMGGTFTTYSGSLVNGIVKVLGNGQQETTSSVNPGAGNAGFNSGVGFSGSIDVRDIKLIISTAGVGVAAWSAGGDLTAAQAQGAGFGTLDAAVVAGGTNTAGTTIATVQEYDGTTWTSVTSLPAARYSITGLGTQTAGVAVGGCFGATGPFADTYEYDGTSWGASVSMNTARGTPGASGIQTDALVWGGITTGGTNTNTAETYNGTAWANSPNNLTEAMGDVANSGTSTSALSAGGNNPTWACTYCYNGSAWSLLSPATVFYNRRLARSLGTYSCTVTAGGSAFAPVTNCTQTWNGTTWAAGCNITTARSSHFGAGYLTSATGLIAGGNDGTNRITSTEEWDDGTTGVAGISCIIAAGNFTAYCGTLRSRIAAINLRDGSLIATSSFNPGTGGFNAAVNSLFIEPQTNKILATGNFTSYSGSAATRIARINVSGSIDSGSSFNTGTGLNDTGSVIYAYTSGSTPVILIGGTFTQYSGSQAEGLVRILNSGSIDPRFDEGGFTLNTLVEDVIAHSDGKIVAVGGFTRYSGSFTQNRISKINPNGTIDATYTPAGTWTKVTERGTGEAAAAGATIALFYRNTGANPMPAGTAVTASLGGSITAKAATGWAFYYQTRPSSSRGSVGSATANPLSTVSGSNLVNREYLFIRGTAVENGTITFTTSSAIGGYTALTQAATAGGAAATNIAVVGEFRIATTSSLSSTPTSGTSTSNASILWTFFEQGKTYYLLID